MDNKHRFDEQSIVGGVLLFHFLVIYYKKKGGSNMKENLSGQTLLKNLLNGTSLGIVLVLMPGAIFGELFKLLAHMFPQMQTLATIMSFTASMMSVAVGVAVSMLYKFTPIQTISISMSGLVGSGALSVNPEGGFLLKGMGDVINTGITIAVAVIVVQLIGDRLKAYNLLVLPALVMGIAGSIGLFTLPYVSAITTYIGMVIQNVTELQPVVMGSLLAMIFAILIVSPISTVGIATAISLSGIGSGTANLGIVAAGFGLAIAGWSVNQKGTSFAHFIGSPKIQMANTIKKPLTMLPILCNAAILGALGGMLTIQGTPTSAGFGISGLLGPVNALNLAEGGWSLSNILLIAVLFIVLPLALGLFFQKLFSVWIPLVEPNDYKISFD